MNIDSQYDLTTIILAGDKSTPSYAISKDSQQQIHLFGFLRRYLIFP
jgi:hypothetical protein